MLAAQSGQCQDCQKKNDFVDAFVAVAGDPRQELALLGLLNNQTR
jgi:hypothetical protein